MIKGLEDNGGEAPESFWLGTASGCSIDSRSGSKELSGTTVPNELLAVGAAAPVCVIGSSFMRSPYTVLVFTSGKVPRGISSKNVAKVPERRVCLYRASQPGETEAAGRKNIPSKLSIHRNSRSLFALVLETSRNLPSGVR